MQIDALTESGMTAAFLALANGHLDTFELLVQKGASVDLVKSICNKESKDGDIACNHHNTNTKEIDLCHIYTSNGHLCACAKMFIKAVYF